MDNCGICNKPVVQLFETGRKGVFACFKCQPLSLVPEVTMEQDNSEVILSSEDSVEVTVEQDSSLSIGQDISLTSSGTQEENEGQELYCAICNKSFQKSTQLQNHLRNHRAERRFVCTYCNKAFSQSNNLRAHLRIHTNERPYQCTVCDKAFTQVTNLNNHMRLHTGERPFVCPEPGCNKAYAQVTNLNQHRKRHQNGRMMDAYYVCTICGEQFDQRNHMYTHRRQAHSEVQAKSRHECKICSQVCATQQALMKHIAAHMNPVTTTQRNNTQKVYKCVFSSCGSEFESPSAHTEHLLRAHQLRILSVPDDVTRPAPKRGRPPKKDPLDLKDDITYEVQVDQLKGQSQFLPKLKVQSLFQ